MLCFGLKPWEWELLTVAQTEGVIRAIDKRREKPPEDPDAVGQR